MQSTARDLLRDQRVSFCLRSVLPERGSVEVWKGEKLAHYSGLITCGSVWHCPVCASKISETRRKELEAGVESWRAGGGSVVMVTLTVPHYAHEPVGLVLKRFSRARGLMRNRKGWKRWAGELGMAGSVRALEVTHGANGWHVHSHELLFLAGPPRASMDELTGEVLELWQSACLGAGLELPNEHGASVQDGTVAARYAGKWGLEYEVTKAHLKRGRVGNSTPWDLLRRVFEDRDEGAAVAFQEYAKAFKGKRQLVWSKGMRDRLGLGVETPDEELAGKVDEGSELLGALTLEEWRVVLQKNKRGELLAIAAAGGWDAVLRTLKKWGHGGKVIHFSEPSEDMWKDYDRFQEEQRAARWERGRT